MRAVEVRVRPTGGWFGPFHRSAATATDLSIEAVHALRLLNDGTTVLLYEFDGSPEAAERVAKDHLDDTAVDWQVTAFGGRHLMYANVEPSDLTAGILSLLDEWTVVVDWPIQLVDDRTLLVTLVGDEAEISGILESVPDGIRVSVERTGGYRPDTDRLVASLTARERDTLAAAVDLGYYRNPREARYEDVAEVVGCSAGTVGHHLRNAEEKVMRALLAHD